MHANQEYQSELRSAVSLATEFSVECGLPGISFSTYNKNNVGPRTDPYGTPDGM